MKTLIIIASIMLMTIGLSCAALSSYITPAEVDQNALRYAVNTGIVELSDYDAWYPNLAEAERLAKDVDAAHSTVQLSLQQQAEKDNLVYSIHKDVVSTNLITADQREEMLFGETGLMSMGLSMMGAGGLAGLLGLMRKRPKDWTPEEVEIAMTGVKGELTEKDKQIIELVRGVQKFLDTSDKTVSDALKTSLATNQSSTTKETVAKIKVTV